MRKKELELDFIKIFCAIFIVYQHTVSQFILSEQVGPRFQWLFGSFMNFTRFSVILFMIISGYLMIKSYSNLSYKKFYEKKFIKFLKTYLLVILFYSIVNIELLNQVVTIKEFIKWFICGQVFYHTWYLIVLLKIYLIFPLLKKIVIWITSKKEWFIYLVSITIIQFIVLKYLPPFIYEYIGQYQNVFARSFVELLDRSLLLWFYYFLLGGIVCSKIDVIKNTIKKYRVIIFVIFIILFYKENNLAFYNKLPNGIPNYNMTSPSSYKLIMYFIFSAIILYLIGMKIIESEKLNLNKTIEYLSEYTLGVYIIHPFTLYLLNAYFFNRLNINNKVIQFVLLFILTLGISFVLAFVYNTFKKSFMINKKSYKNINNSISK